LGWVTWVYFSAVYWAQEFLQKYITMLCLTLQKYRAYITGLINYLGECTQVTDLFSIVTCMSDFDLLKHFTESS